jgi:nicotinamidase-related amidase
LKIFLEVGWLANGEEVVLQKIYENTRGCRRRKASLCTARLSPIFSSQPRSPLARLDFSHSLSVPPPSLLLKKETPMKTAVLVIDVQQGLCEGEGKAHDCQGLFSNINRVTAQARSVGAPVIFIQHESPAGYLEYGSAAWQLADGLHVAQADLRLRKTTPDSFLRTSLDTILKERGIDHLVICGMHSEFCVDTTTRQALARGLPVTLVSDAHTSAGNSALTPQQVIAHHNATLTNISSFGPRVTATPCSALTIAPFNSQ